MLTCRFLFAFGGAGAVTFLTAATGLAGVACNSRALLGLYSVLMVLLLLAQVDHLRAQCGAEMLAVLITRSPKQCSLCSLFWSR